MLRARLASARQRAASVTAAAVVVVVAVVAAGAGGCFSRLTNDDWNQRAIAVAIERGKFDLGCDALAPTPLGAPVRDLDEHSLVVGVSGCSTRAVYLTRCLLRPDSLRWSAADYVPDDIKCQALLNSESNATEQKRAAPPSTAAPAPPTAPPPAAPPTSPAPPPAPPPGAPATASP